MTEYTVKIKTIPILLDVPIPKEIVEEVARRMLAKIDTSIFQNISGPLGSGVVCHEAKRTDNGFEYHIGPFAPIKQRV